MLTSLTALVALQSLDSAAEAARRRVSEMPAAEQALEAQIATAAAAVDAAKARLLESQNTRRALEKDVAAVDTRLARFEDHKAAVKTNQEYTALLHEMATAKAEKEAIEERILLRMEEADALAAELKTDETALNKARKDAESGKRAMAAERATLDANLARIAAERERAVADVEPALLVKYEQLLKARRGVAVARMTGELCTACHVRLRPHVAQQVRRNDAIVQCDSCQRILYFEASQAPETQASATG